jgi:hypothetical protein
MSREEQPAKPDVEAIIRQIQAAARAAERPVDPGVAEWAAADADLDGILADASRHCVIGQAQPRGAKRLVYRVLRRMLAPLIGEANRYNTLSVRAINKLAQLLTGNDTATQSDLLAQTRRRIDLLTALGARLDAYDALALDARLRRIEQQLAEPPEQEAP